MDWTDKGVKTVAEIAAWIPPCENVNCRHLSCEMQRNPDCDDN